MYTEYPNFYVQTHSCTFSLPTYVRNQCCHLGYGTVRPRECRKNTTQPS